MRKLKRNDFLRISTLAMLAPLIHQLSAMPPNRQNDFTIDEDLLKRLITANDQQVAGLLQTIQTGQIVFARKIGYDFAALASAYSSPGSMYYHNPLLISKLESLNAALISQQTADGTVNIGNLESPPDTAFLVELLTAAVFILKKDNSNGLVYLKKKLQMPLEPEDKKNVQLAVDQLEGRGPKPRK